MVFWFQSSANVKKHKQFRFCLYENHLSNLTIVPTRYIVLYLQSLEVVQKLSAVSPLRKPKVRWFLLPKVMGRVHAWDEKKSYDVFHRMRLKIDRAVCTY